VAWRYPDQPMCSEEVTGQRTPEPTDDDPSPSPVPIVKRWCGTGWTGQPLVWERPDGVTEVIVGAYDGAIHFLDAATGAPTRPRFQTGFMIKGTLTLDPDGHPLLYGGSRDNHLRVIALDRDAPTELWRLGPNPQRVWNDDWDGNPSIVDDILYVGGEDSWFYAIELNRALGDDGLVTVDPEILVQTPGWSDQLLRDVGDRNVSIESSVVVHDERVYFTNSGGRVVGLDVSDVRSGEAPLVFDYWLGDDADASLAMVTSNPALDAARRLPARRLQDLANRLRADGVAAARLLDRRPGRADAGVHPRRADRRGRVGQPLPDRRRPARAARGRAAWFARRHGVEVDPDTTCCRAAGSKEAIFHLPAGGARPARAAPARAVGRPRLPGLRPRGGVRRAGSRTR
jgi:hypothetical protein